MTNKSLRSGATTAVLGLLYILSLPSALAAPGPRMHTAVSNVQLATIDLTPGDGLGADYSISSQHAYFSQTIISDGQYADWFTSPGIYDSVDNVLDQHPFSAAMGSPGGIGNATATLTWDASQPDPGYAFLSGSYSAAARLSLSPGSALLVTGTLLQQFTPAGMHSSDRAESDFSVKLESFGTGTQASYSSVLSHTSPHQDGQGWDLTRDFSLVLTNPGNSWRTVDLSFSVDTVLSTNHPLSPVPEPAGYAMLCAGLAVLGGMSRRRRS